MLQNDNYNYGLVSRSLHWVIALLILCLLTVGFGMGSLPYSPFKGTVYGFHKSFGLCVLALAVFRIVWKHLTPQPAHLTTHVHWEITLAKVIHILLYGGMIIMPLSGWVMSAAGQHAVPFFWLFNVPPIVPKNETLANLAFQVHSLSAYALLAAVALHYAGALKHHVIDHDETLRRMGGNLLIAGVGALLLLAPVAAMLPAEWNEEHPDKVPAAMGLAPAAAPVTVEVTAAPAWVIDKAASSIGFEFTQYGQAVSGSFGDFDGSIRFDAANLPESLADIRIQAASLITGESGRDEQAQGGDWFNAAAFPEIRFTSKNFTHQDGNHYSAAGSLTIRDVSKDVTLPFTLDIQGARAVMKADLTLNRLDFGVGQGEWAATDTIGGDVKIKISLAASRE